MPNTDDLYVQFLKDKASIYMHVFDIQTLKNVRLEKQAHNQY